MSLLDELKSALESQQAPEAKTAVFTKVMVRKPQEVSRNLAAALPLEGEDWRLLADAVRKNPSVTGAFQRTFPKPKVTVTVYTSGTVTCQGGDVREILGRAGLSEYIL